MGAYDCDCINNLEYDRRERKAQLSQEGTTSDLISRQQALDIFDDYNVSVENGELEAYRRDGKRLCELPTIQPQSTAGQLNDSAQSTNLIDRQAAIDLFPNDVLEWDTLNGYIAPHVARRLIEQLPTAQPEPQWIPVSERLPRDDTWNIFTDGKNISVERYKADAIDHFFPNGRWFQLEDVIAWMPLPSPYQKGATT